MTKALVSVVMPIYNVKEFLPQAIESIIHQTYENLEILLIDDGSTDGSGKIADEYTKKDSRIVVHHKQNGGLSDTRNYGLKKATGKYITFPDSDDFFEDKFVQTAVDELNKTDASVFCANYNLVDEDGKPSFEARKEGTNNAVLNSNDAIELILSNKLNNYIWQFTYKRDMLIDMNFEFLKDVFYEDIVATPEILFAAKKIIFSNSKLYNYRIRKSSIVHARSLKKLEDMEYVINSFINFTKKNSIGNDALRKQFKFPLLMSVYIGYVSFKGQIESEHLKRIRLEIINSKQANMAPKEKVKYFLIKSNLIKLRK